MIRVIISYPNEVGARFDEDYYLSKHMPMVAARLGPHGMTNWSVDRGLAGFAPGSPADHMIHCYLDFETLEGLQAGMAAESASILADVPNYTDLQPRVQINQVLR